LIAENQMELILSVRSKGITDPKLLKAMESIPREMFLDGPFQPRAYADTPLPIDCGQTISQPSVVAQMTQALEVTQGCKVLEIGTGSGYQAAILAKLTRRVYTIERHRPLARLAAKRLSALDLGHVTVVTGDGSLGLPAQSPFDRILLTAASEDPPALLLKQLRVGGIMVLPVGQSDMVQTLIKIEKSDKGLEYTELGEVRFVPLLEGIAEDIA
jgi:protein-L-isoaspartate(D-aspartate) O-methyltransferase